MHNFKELKVWRKTRELVKQIYQATVDFPSEEKFGLTSQIRRASVSISLNIAEGAGRRTTKAFVGFLNNAYSSAYEVECASILAKDLGYWEEEKSNGIIEKTIEIQKMLFGLIESINQKNNE